MVFTETELRAIAHGLIVAATVYDEDAGVIEYQIETHMIDSDTTDLGHRRIADQFKRQASEARRISDKITAVIG
jgi:hypothetical protein